MNAVIRPLAHPVLLDQDEGGKQHSLKGNQHAQQRERVRVEAPPQAVDRNPGSKPNYVHDDERYAAHEVSDGVRSSISQISLLAGALLKLYNRPDVLFRGSRL